MTEIELIYADDLSRQIHQVKELLVPFKWSTDESNLRHSIIDALKVYGLGKREVCFIHPETIEKLSKIVWQELTDRQTEMEQDFAKL